MRVILLIVTYFIFTSSLFSEIRGNYKGNYVEIYWSEPDDILLEYFIIERSKNGRYFKPIMKIKCGSKKADYYEIDYNAPSKIAYYRIKQLTNKGYQYSKTLIVRNHRKDRNHKKKLKGFKENNVIVVLTNKLGIEYFSKIDVFVKKES